MGGQTMEFSLEITDNDLDQLWRRDRLTGWTVAGDLSDVHVDAVEQTSDGLLRVVGARLIHSHVTDPDEIEYRIALCITEAWCAIGWEAFEPNT